MTTTASQITPTQSRPARGTNPFRIALVGCGAVARANLLPVLAGHERIHLSALIDRDGARARELAGAYQVPDVLTDLGALDASQFDGVVLATPPAHHAPATIAMVGRGLHVFVEKPMAATAADADAMVEAADRAGVTLGVGLYRRFLPSVRLLKHLVETEEYGAPLTIDIEEGGTYSWQLATLDVLTRAAGGGGVLMDIGTHLIDELLFAVPGEFQIRCYEDNSRGGIETDCQLHAALTTAHGPVPVRLELSRTRDLRNSIRIECEQATLELPRAAFTQVLVHRASQGIKSNCSTSVKLTAEWAGAGGFIGYQAFRDEIDDWLGAIEHSTPPVLSGRSVVPVTRAIDDCYHVRTPIDEPWTDEGLARPSRDVGPALGGTPARPKRVLVTGAGGFLGGRAVEMLREREGWDVVALVRRPGSAARLSRWAGEIALGDVCSAADMKRVMQGCDAVVHCAVGTDWPPDAARRTTVEGTRVVAEAALGAGVKRFVHISTMNVHRRDLPGVLDEMTPLEPPAGDRYGQAKLDAERVVGSLARKGLSTVILRPTRIYGPFSKTFTIRPLQAISAGTFAIAGNPDVPANMVYVDNVVEAIVQALDASDAVAGQAFFVTDPDQVTLREFYGFFARTMSRQIACVADLPVSDRDRHTGLLTGWMSGLQGIAQSAEFRGFVRSVLYTDPIGKWPRRVWDRSPALQATLLRRFGSNAAVVFRPSPAPGTAPLLYYGEPANVSAARAQASLGFQGAVSRRRAMELTLQWARHARLVPEETGR